jgi:thiamine-phosphate pyrophosphorylase
MMSHAQRMARFVETDLYVVITEAFCAGRSALEILDAALAAGVRLIQLREKDLTDRELYERARQFREHTRRAGALLIIDDRIDVALAADADGVHLGQGDLPADVARRIASELIIGASTHGLDEALAAEAAGASYVNIGPLFATGTKAASVAPLGIPALDRIAPHLHVPWTTMGGIKRHNIEQVLRCGARHVAVVTAVTEAPDVRAAAAELRALMRSFAQRDVVRA